MNFLTWRACAENMDEETFFVCDARERHVFAYSFSENSMINLNTPRLLVDFPSVLVSRSTMAVPFFDVIRS